MRVPPIARNVALAAAVIAASCGTPAAAQHDRGSRYQRPPHVTPQYRPAPRRPAIRYITPIPLATHTPQPPDTDQANNRASRR